jgi:hypothetical protein
VLVAAQHNALWLANALASLDALSAGRLTIGIGVGWSQAEFEALGQSFHDRGRRTDEIIGPHVTGNMRMFRAPFIWTTATFKSFCKTPTRKKRSSFIATTATAAWARPPIFSRTDSKTFAAWPGASKHGGRCLKHRLASRVLGIQRRTRDSKR